ncbi:hypothetical protein HZZ00_04465 [Streptomyces sp. NEAU-sy36]|uniref:hypothetical protein n=1 Tax=unclassified Streptomyces TaxID=2593676 RepID=UPI0015D63CAD|nr:MULTISPECIES: hypothetical protein [unclassified Streptomyces]QLJ00308.1 hypothetical protein HZZ00_04465 [Streptomyces sp. NEAU-sy36]
MTAIEGATAVDALGPVIGRHQIDHRKRWVNAAWALLVAVPSGWLGVWGLAAAGEGSAGANRAIGLLIGLAVGAVWVAVTQIVRALRGEPGEYIEVRELGLVHGSRRGAAGWTWDRVTSLHVEGDAVNRVATRLGNGYRIEIGFDDGRRLRADGLTAYAADLGRVLLARCPQVALRPRVPWWGRAGGWLLVWAALCLLGIVGQILYIVGHPDHVHRVRTALGMATVTDAPGISDTGYVLLTFGMLLCFVAAVTFVVLFVRGRAYRRLSAR